MNNEDLSVKFPNSQGVHVGKSYWFMPIYEALIVGLSIFVIISLTSYFVYYEARKALINEIGHGLVTTANSIAAQLDTSFYQEYRSDDDRDKAYFDAETLFRQVIDSNTAGTANLPDVSKTDKLKLQECVDYHTSIAISTTNSDITNAACDSLRDQFFVRQSISYIYTFRVESAANETEDSNKCGAVNHIPLSFLFDAGQLLDYEEYSAQEIAENYIKYGEKSSIEECYDDMNNELLNTFLHFISTPRATAKIGIAETKLRKETGFGYLLSGYAPLYNQHNQFIGLLGVDINASEFETRLKPIENAIFRTIVAGFFIAFLIAALVWFLRNFSKVINARRLQLIADAQSYLDSERKQ